MARAWYRYYVERDFRGALAIMRTVILDEPNDTRAWYTIGLLTRRLAQIDESVMAFRQARVLSPNDYSAISELAVTLWTAQRYPRGAGCARCRARPATRRSGHARAQAQHPVGTQGLPAGATMLAALKQDSASVIGLRAQQAEFERDDARAATLYQQAIAAYSTDDFAPGSFAGYTPLTWNGGCAWR
jgi:tetratricopeptide (TPR) repeat protein